MCRIKKSVSMENRICLQKTGGSVEAFAMEGKERVATGAISLILLGCKEAGAFYQPTNAM